MKETAGLRILHRTSSCEVTRVVIMSVLCLCLTPDDTSAQVTPTTGAGSLNTQVTQVGNVYEITQGTQAGSNLFHSFGNFSIGAAETARFQTTTLAPDGGIQNILGRVTGGNPSSIFGTIDSVNYYPNANLFLMNPAGIVFGPNATLNVGGSVAFTTADYLRLDNGQLFHATPNAIADPLLSASPVAAFGFLGPNFAAITVQGSTLSVPAGKSLTFVGGDVTVGADPATGTTATLLAPAGEIRLASVASPGEILLPDLQTGPNINNQSFTSMGAVTIGEGSTLDVTDNAFELGGSGGTVRIRGGQFTLDNSIIFANTFGDIDGNRTALSVNMQDDVTVTNGSGIIALGGGTGRVGDIEIVSQNVRFEGGSFAYTANVDSAEVGGNIAVNSTTSTFVSGSALTTETLGSSGGGSLSVHSTDSLSLSGNDAFGNASRINTVASGSGNGGTLSVTGESLNIAGGAIDTISISTGNAGNLTVSLTGNVTITGGGSIATQGGDIGASGNLNVMADNVSISGQAGPLNRSSITNFSQTAPNGNTIITARQFLLTDNATINVQNNTSQPGTLAISATKSATIANQASVRMATGEVGGGLMQVTAPMITIEQAFLQTRTAGAGDAGAVNLTASNLTMAGALVRSETSATGRGGTVTLNVADNITITGQFNGNPDNFPAPAGIYTDTFATGSGGNIVATAGQIQLTNGATISSKTSGSGNAGNILVKANDVAMNTGATITAASTGAGNAGTVTIQGTNSPANSIVIAGVGTGLFTDTQATGTGGNIDLNARTITLQNSGTVSANSSGTNAAATGGSITMNAMDQVTMTNGSAVTASSTGPGNAGNISIHAGQRFEMQNSSVKTEAAQASGGNIDVQAIDQVRLVNSTISTSVLGGSGSGGNITIDPNVVVLQNSRIIAQAIQGAGGNITIFTPLFLADSTSLVSASSQFGLNGTVTIQSPTSNLSGSLGVLSSKTAQAQGLLTQRCAALANGQASSFVVAGREQLPADPGGWLTSPLAFAGLESDRFDNGAVASAPMALTIQDTETVSLRRITPPDFLIAHFAESEATGCRS